MQYNLTQFEHGDLYQLTSFLNNAWEFDTITEDLLKEKLIGDPGWQPDLALVYRSKEQIIGFMLGVIRNIKGTRYGYIKLMAVGEKYRRQGLAKSMYAQLEASFVKQNVDIVRIYDVPLNYWMPGIDPKYTPALCWVMRLGFKRFGDASNLLVDLNQDWGTSVQEKKLTVENIEILRAKPGDKQLILDFIKDEWAIWSNEVEMAFKDDPPSIHMALVKGKVKAFAAHNANNKGTGWFGPMGTHSDLRGKGIGAILLKRCLNDMKETGIKHSIIPWAAHIDFYAWHANAEVQRIFWRFEKHLKK